MESKNALSADLTPEEAKARLVELEKAKMSRRQALGRLGFTYGAAVVAALTSDELLRAVGRQMERVETDNQVARQVAQEFKNAGVALAGPYGRCNQTAQQTQCLGANVGPCCHSANTNQNNCLSCCQAYYAFGMDCWGSFPGLEICSSYCSY